MVIHKHNSQVDDPAQIWHRIHRFPPTSAGAPLG